MISSLDPSSQTFLTGLNQIQQRLQTAQQQLTTGLKINNVSDDPSQIANLWQTRANLAQVQQINSNLGNVCGITESKVCVQWRTAPSPAR